MWYDQAEAWVQLATFVAAGSALVATSAWRRWRPLPLVILAFGAGLYLGIHETARGRLKLPLGPMQAQLSQIWGIAPDRLQPPAH